MKQLIFIIVVFITANITKAQDLIVTDRGDSLNCKITKIKKDYIYFAFKFENEVKNTLLHVDQIKFFEIDFFAIPEFSYKKVKNIKDFQKVRLGFFGGPSYMLGKISDDVPEDFIPYYKKLKSGYHLGGDIRFFTSEYFGLGLKYMNFKTQNKIEKIYATNTVTGVTMTGSLEDDITIQYFGPIVSAKFHNKNNNIFFLINMSMGYIGYKNYATLIDSYTLTGNTIGEISEFIIDIKIDKNFAFGCGLSYMVGSMSSIKKDGEVIKLEDDEYISVSRIDFSLGLRLYF